MNPGIRHATNADCEAIASLVERYWTFEHIEGFERGRIERLLQRIISQPDRGCCWVATEDAVLRGYLLAVYLFSLEFGGTAAEIDEFYVLDGHREKGIGSRLLQQATLDMKQRGIVYVELQVGSANHTGRAFYERFGFAGREGYTLVGKRL
jgi:ribosomal protein S18 acetylase RimI-like enzyme